MCGRARELAVERQMYLKTEASDVPSEKCTLTEVLCVYVLANSL